AEEVCCRHGWDENGAALDVDRAAYSVSPSRSTIRPSNVARPALALIATSPLGSPRHPPTPSVIISTAAAASCGIACCWIGKRACAAVTSRNDYDDWQPSGMQTNDQQTWSGDMRFARKQSKKSRGC